MLRFMVLGLLRRGERVHGSALWKAYERRSGYAIQNGKFYRALKGLTETGLIRPMSNPQIDPRRTPYEITAAGIEVAKVRPTLSPRYTLAAVKARVIRPPSSIARSVSSRRPASSAALNTDSFGSLDVAHQSFHRPAQNEEHGAETHREIDDMHVLGGHGRNVVGIESTGNQPGR